MSATQRPPGAEGDHRESPRPEGQGKPSVDVPAAGGGNQQASVPIDQIAPNPHQPRSEFREEELAELAASISLHGILQPILVAKSADPASPQPYTLIAGERRLRAAKSVGMQTIPCIFVEANQEQMLEWALIENIHRSDLNPIERANAYGHYMDRFALSAADVAERLGQPRTTVANYLRLLELCDDARKMVASGALSFGHAKVLGGLVGAPDLQAQLAHKVVADSITVRELEQIISQPASLRGATGGGDTSGARVRPAYIRDLEDRLSAAVGTRISVLPGRSKNTGRLVIEYYSLDDFDRISAMLGLEPENG